MTRLAAFRRRARRMWGKVQRRALVHAAKSVPCADCGVRYPYYVMEFDHLDPLRKAGNINYMMTRAPVTTLKLEMSKCDVVCANCHRVRTHGRMITRGEIDS